MDKNEDLLQLISEQGILSLYFYKDPEVNLQVLNAFSKELLEQKDNTNRSAD